MNNRFLKLIYIFECRYMILLILLEIKNDKNEFDIYIYIM